MESPFETVQEPAVLGWVMDGFQGGGEGSLHHQRRDRGRESNFSGLSVASGRWNPPDSTSSVPDSPLVMKESSRLIAASGHRPARLRRPEN